MAINKSELIAAIENRLYEAEVTHKGYIKEKNNLVTKIVMKAEEIEMLRNLLKDD